MKFRKFRRHSYLLWIFISRNYIVITLIKALFIMTIFYTRLIYAKYLSIAEIKTYQNTLTIWSTDYHIR